MVLETIQPVLSSYFLNPAGLIGLSALLPLIIFYLIKKDPEKEVMPSFMFFQNRGDAESTSQAFRMISRNLILLFHILVVTAFALAFAEPFLESGGQPENAVLILDRSGSMAELGDAKNFLLKNLGEENTIIIVDDESRVVAESVSASRAQAAIRKVKPAQTETDIASGMEKTRRLEGSIFIGSDLDQTADNTDPEPIVESLSSSGRNVQVMKTERRNRHGIIDLNVGENQTSLDVKNFQQDSRTVEISSGNQTREISLEGKSVETVSFESREGENTVQLSKDEFSADNTAYFYVPEEREVEIAYLSESENPYLAKAFELIEFTTMTHYTPPVEGEINGDIYIIGSSEGILSQTVREIEEDVKSGSNLVIFGKNGFSELGFQNLPVEDKGDKLNNTVTIKEPVDTSLGEMEIRHVERNTGERYSAGSNALVKSSYGEGEFLLYNIDDRRFRNDFLYPVFWKEIASEMTERPSISGSNRKTGEELNQESITSPEGKKYSGRHKISKTGFYETSGGTVAANMLSEDESLRDTIEMENLNSEGETSELSLHRYLVALLLLLIVIELGYLYRIGDLK